MYGPGHAYLIHSDDTSTFFTANFIALPSSGSYTGVWGTIRNQDSHRPERRFLLDLESLRLVPQPSMNPTAPRCHEPNPLSAAWSVPARMASSMNPTTVRRGMGDTVRLVRGAATTTPDCITAQRWMKEEQLEPIA